MKKVVWSRLRLAGHIKRMSEERLTKRAGKTEVGGRRRRGRPKLRWMDSVKRDIEMAEMNSRERESKWCGSPTPLRGEMGRRRCGVRALTYTEIK